MKCSKKNILKNNVYNRVNREELDFQNQMYWEAQSWFKSSFVVNAAKLSGK